MFYNPYYSIHYFLFNCKYFNVFFFSLILLISSFINVANSNTCVTLNFEQLIEKFEYVPTECENIIDYAVFVPTNSTIQHISKKAFISMSKARLLPSSCRIPLSKFICANAYRKCQFYSLSDQLPNFIVFTLPTQPCKQLCFDVLEECQDFIEELPDCNAFNKKISGPSYPSEESIFTINSQNFSVPCQNFENSSSELSDPNSCPYPLELDLTKDPVCTRVCPFGRLFSEQDEQAFYILRAILSAISSVLDILIFFTLITIKKKRTFPANLVILAVFLHFFWVFALLIGSIIGTKNVLCVDETTFSNTYYHAFCGIEGFCAHFFGLATTFAWLEVMLWLWLMVVWEVSPSKIVKFEIPSFIFPIVIPTIGSIVVLATEGYYPSHAWCFIKDKTMGNVFFWSWVYFCSLGVLIMVTWTFYHIIRNVIRMLSAGVRKNVMENKKVFIFVIGFSINFAVHISYQILYNVKRSIKKKTIYKLFINY
eukprot:TRINITY_DN1272_c0_g1_i4.p1 TRINITY_DN1272_c0_g1~~TRINITY_DN1272_c0_g1_i4.p1  ORF type:complete len:482 (+),score=137.48 TRINITY_DN1272_c0_g1_i4:185-1630(+)